MPIFIKGQRIDDYNLLFSPIFKYNRKFNSSGNIIEITEELTGIIYSKYVFNYDDMGKLIEKTQLNSNNTIIKKTKFKYNDKSNVSEEKIYEAKYLSEKCNLKLYCIYKYIYTYWE